MKEIEVNDLSKLGSHLGYPGGISSVVGGLEATEDGYQGSVEAYQRKAFFQIKDGFYLWPWANR